MQNSRSSRASARASAPRRRAWAAARRTGAAAWPWEARLVAQMRPAERLLARLIEYPGWLELRLAGRRVASARSKRALVQLSRAIVCLGLLRGGGRKEGRQDPLLEPHTTRGVLETLGGCWALSRRTFLLQRLDKCTRRPIIQKKKKVYPPSIYKKKKKEVPISGERYYLS